MTLSRNASSEPLDDAVVIFMEEWEDRNFMPGAADDGNDLEAQRLHLECFLTRRELD